MVIGMDVVWIVLGALILGLALLDAFLAVLNYDEEGILVNRLVRWQWLALRAITRHVSRRWRAFVLRQVTGVLILTTILLWIGSVILGFAFIYLGLIGFGRFQLSTGVNPDFLGALYLSIGQFATVGADNVSPDGGWINLLPVLQALLSVVMLSFIITFLSNVYNVIQLLRSLCADFFSVGPGVGSAVEALAPYFPDGQPRDLDRHLGELIGDFNLYCDGLRQDHAAYQFQSGDDQFSLPFALYMTSDVVAALRWGVPTGHEASQSPSLPRLIEAFDDFRERRYRKMRWATPADVTPVTADEFAAASADLTAGGLHAGTDPWVLQFLTLNADMARLIRASAPGDLDDAYARYLQWLPFASRAQAFVAAVSLDLDYQPIYRGTTPVPGSAPQPALSQADAPPRRSGASVRGRRLLIDPGGLRLSDALRALASVVAAIAVVVPLANAAGANAVSGAVFAGLVALFAAPATAGVGRGRESRWTGILALVPALVGVALGIVLPHDPLWSVFALAVVAAAAAWMQRFGPVIGGFGQLLFIAYYFTLLLGMQVSDLAAALVAVTIGIVFAWIANLIPGPSPRRVLDGGLAAVYERTSVSLDAMIDIVSTGGAHTRLLRSLSAQHDAHARTAEMVTANLDQSGGAGISPLRENALRMCLFDVQLATSELVGLIPVISSVTITVDQRSRLTAEMIEVQRRLAPIASGAAPAHEPIATTIPATWPRDARRTLGAIIALDAAVDRLRHAQHDDDANLAATVGSSPLPAAVDAGPAARKDPFGTRAVPAGAARASDRRAVQAGLSTGIALFLGSLVSTSHQYWAAMPAFQVLSGSDGETRMKGFQRILATVLGSAVAFGIAILANHNPFVAFPLLFVSVFFMAFLRAVSSPWLAFWQTLLLATMYDVLGTLSVETVQTRVLETLIGAIVAVVISALILPTRTRARVLRGMGDLVADASALVATVFARAATGASTADLGPQKRDLGRRLTALEQIAKPLRHQPGSLQRTGIEAQLTGMWSLAGYGDRLARSIRTLTPDERASVDWQAVSAATADDFAAVQAVLADRLPARIHSSDDFPVDPGTVASPGLRETLLNIQRLNQTLLSLVDAVRPGTVAATDDAARPAADLTEVSSVSGSR